MSTFASVRRQQVIGEHFYRELLAYRVPLIGKMRRRLPKGDVDDEHRALLWQSIAEDEFELLALCYTAGEPIEPLREQLSKVIAAHEKWRDAKSIVEADPDEPALYFAEIAQYERCVQLIGLCYLLHRRDLLPRIAALQDATYSGTDTLYEDLLAWELEGRHDVDAWYHDKPYRDLINSMYRDSDGERIADIKTYCKAWYPAMSAAPWHDSHLRVTDTDGDFFGYWAFEAGAVAYLLDLDDSSIDHMVYPKDLVRFAREFDASNKKQSELSVDRVRAHAGEPCPREGYWFTPASLNSLRRFAFGEVMPEIAGDYGATIWQWDEQQ